MAEQRNIWKDSDDWKVHITNSELMESVCQKFNFMNQMDSCTKYYDGNIHNPIAWDIIVPDKFINDVKKHIKDFV